MEKTLIEESSTDVLDLFDEISEEAKKEKNAVPPINKILYWWTRKPLIVGRAIVLTSTLNNIQTVRTLLGLKREKRAYTYIPDIEIYKKQFSEGHSNIKILDPFGGAGNIIFEAKRLGLDCSISDYNPVAYLLERAVLEYPSRYGSKLAEDFEKYANRAIEQTKNEIGKFYKEEDLTYFWVWCIKCPYCNQRVPLTNNMWLSNTKNKIGIKFTAMPDKNFKTEIIFNIKSEDGKKFTQMRGRAKCISCTNPIDYQSITEDITKRKDREMIVKQTRIAGERKYFLASEEDKNLFKSASNYLKLNLEEYQKSGIIPDEKIKPSHQDTLGHFGIKYWNDFFSERQLLTMITFMKNIRSIVTEISDKDYQKVICVYLGFLLCKHINGNSLGTMWHSSAEKPEDVLSLRRPAFIYNHVEINPFQRVKGSLKNSLSNISKAISFASVNSIIPTEISLESVLKLNSDKNKYDLIITDPPYLDDVQYGELSEFFYVWLSRILTTYFPELPARVELDEDICVSKYRFGNKKLAMDFFIKGLKISFVSMRKVLNDDGLLVIFFAHSSIEAWNLLLESIRESKFYVVSSYAIHTEMVSSVMARGKTSFMSSIVVVCRKLNQNSTAYFEDIIPHVEDKIKEMLDRISSQKLLSIPLTDLLIMVYGKVLEGATNHTELKSYKKDFKPEFESLISNSRDFILKEIVTKLTGRSINLLGSQISFYLLTKIFYRGILSGDDLLKVTRTYGVTKEGIEKDRLAKNDDGNIRLYFLHENKNEKKPEEVDNKNIHEQLCYLIQLVDDKDTTKLTTVLSNSNFRVDDLKQIISLLLKSYRLRLNKKEKLLTEEQNELKKLETLSDTMGIKSENSLDSFM